jgi:G patch domain-containing protein 1
MNFQSNSKLCRDGRPPLDGFILSFETLPEPKWFAAPSVPDSFLEKHVFAIPDGDSRVPAANIANLTPDQRRDILGETPLHGPERSVFDYIPMHLQEKLQNQIALAQEKSKSSIPKVDKNVALMALQGYMPFENNLPKQNRYKLYLEVMAERSHEELVCYLFSYKL